MDVRPLFVNDYRIKFKAEALPLRDRLGGLRLLYSHNVEFDLSHIPKGHPVSVSTLAAQFPVLASLKKSGAKKIDLVHHAIVEEVLQDLGELDFGKNVMAKSNAALWRQRGDHKPLIGEFSFECKFKRNSELHEKVRERCERFFIALQDAARDWIWLGATKTGIVYRLKANPSRSLE